MAGGLAALLDDVAMIAKAASAASTKAVGVVVDDTAVTPQYVRGFAPARELPIIWRISKGSLLNKAILIVLLLLLDHFLPQALTPLLMLGGLYLSFEGAEKIWEMLAGHQGRSHGGEPDVPVVEQEPINEDTMVRSAIITDFVLSAEIMVISLNALNADAAGGHLPLWEKALALVFVALLITSLVYGVVALIVKMDDIGLAMSHRDNESTKRLGKALVGAMPKLLSVLSAVGVVAMMWVGGHILLAGADTLGWHAPYGFAHHLSESVRHVAGIGGALAWLVGTILSAIAAFGVGSILVGVVHLFGLVIGRPHTAGD